MDTKKQYTKGYFFELSLMIGMPLGIAIGVAIKNIAFGPLIGSVIGVTAGIILEKTLNKNPIEISELANAKKRKFYLITLIIGLIFFAGAFSFFILNK